MEKKAPLFGMMAVLVVAAALIAAPAIKAQDKADMPPAETAESDVDNLKAIQGEVAAVDVKENTVTVKDPKNTDVKTNTTILLIDPKTTTIWGEFDEIKLSDLAVGTKIAGEYKINPNKSNTATYLEIITEEEAEMPAAEEAVPAPVTPETPVE
ncbi:MAG TPA: hypothetical protein P5287_01770 [bacterium]|nr:hypothetical protein [bacterium]